MDFDLEIKKYIYNLFVRFKISSSLMELNKIIYKGKTKG